MRSGSGRGGGGGGSVDGSGVSAHDQLPVVVEELASCCCRRRAVLHVVQVCFVPLLVLMIRLEMIAHPFQAIWQMGALRRVAGVGVGGCGVGVAVGMGVDVHGCESGGYSRRNVARAFSRTSSKVAWWSVAGL